MVFYGIISNKLLYVEGKMIGLDIKVNNEYNSYLHKMLNGIDFLKYQWQIYADQIFYKENGNLDQGIFNACVLSGEEFIKCISRNSYWFIFVDIKAYKVGSESAEIETFEDFISSDCELVLLCTDSSYIEIYCKDKEILDMIYNNCTGDEFDKVQYVSCDEASGRGLIAF